MSGYLTSAISNKYIVPGCKTLSAENIYLYLFVKVLISRMWGLTLPQGIHVRQAI